MSKHSSVVLLTLRGCALTLSSLHRSLGQNFLTNPAILQKIADAAKLEPGHPVLEIGPGKGTLTRYLVDTKASLTAIEKDRRLIRSLSANFPQVWLQLTWSFK